MFARWVSESTGSIIETQDALGHKHASTTRVYVQRVAVQSSWMNDQEGQAQCCDPGSAGGVESGGRWRLGGLRMSYRGCPRAIFAVGRPASRLSQASSLTFSITRTYIDETTTRLRSLFRLARSPQPCCFHHTITAYSIPDQSIRLHTGGLSGQFAAPNSVPIRRMGFSASTGCSR